MLELQNVANAVKHGQGSSSYKQLVEDRAAVVTRESVEPELAQFPVLAVVIDVRHPDIVRYRDAILRFWSVDGMFFAPIEAL